MSEPMRPPSSVGRRRLRPWLARRAATGAAVAAKTRAFSSFLSGQLDAPDEVWAALAARIRAEVY